MLLIAESSDDVEHLQYITHTVSLLPVGCSDFLRVVLITYRVVLLLLLCTQPPCKLETSNDIAGDRRPGRSFESCRTLRNRSGWCHPPQSLSVRYSTDVPAVKT